MLDLGAVGWSVSILTVMMKHARPRPGKRQNDLRNIDKGGRGQWLLRAAPLSWRRSMAVGDQMPRKVEANPPPAMITKAQRRQQQAADPAFRFLVRRNLGGIGHGDLHRSAGTDITWG